MADKVPELQVERGAGISYIAGQLFKCPLVTFSGVPAEELGQGMRVASSACPALASAFVS